MRECGLKFHNHLTVCVCNGVTPHAGVWIEMDSPSCSMLALAVTPHAGVWIEIELLKAPFPQLSSLPMRECGLKS